MFLQLLFVVLINSQSSSSIRQWSQNLDLVSSRIRHRLAIRSKLSLLDNEPIHARGESHVQNSRRCITFHTKSVRNAARLIKVGTSNRLVSVTAPKERKRAFQYINCHIFGIMDLERSGVSRQAG